MSTTTTTTLCSTNSEMCQQLSNSFSTTNTTENLSINRNTLAIHMPDINTLVNTPSPSSVASGSCTLDHSPSRSSKNLCSTLKGDHSLKRRARYDRLFHQSTMISRQYMLTMTNLMFQMQRELFQLRRRTRHVERLLNKQNNSSRPVIRIARLTQDEISTICDEDAESIEYETSATIIEENLSLAQTNKPNPIPQIIQHQRQPKRLVNTSKKISKKIWINNRQKPIDYQKYCRLCNREYSKRSNYLLHMRKVHKTSQRNMNINRGDSSDEILFPDNSPEHSDIVTSESESISNQIPATISSPIKLSNPIRTRGRIARKIDIRSPPERRTKCHHCGKTFDMKYIVTHKRLAHGEIVDDENIVVQDDIINLSSVNTPTTIINIAESAVYDEPIRFDDDSQKPIYLALTCLEAHQVDLVNRFLHRFSSRVFQSVNIDKRTTHLVANDEGHPFRSPLSMKLIEAIAHHCFCVSIRWISECLKNDQIIDEIPFEIQGDNTETQAHEGPRRSRLTSPEHLLFNNICFMIKCTENPEMKMTNARLEQLITICGGQIITCVTQRLLEQYTIIVLCDHQYVTERRHNYEQCRKLGIHFVSSDWVLESVLEYRQKPFILFEEIPS